MKAILTAISAIALLSASVSLASTGVAPPEFAVTVEEAHPTGSHDGVPAAHAP